MPTDYVGAISVCAAKVRITLPIRARRIEEADEDRPLLSLHKGDLFDPGCLKPNPNAVPTQVDRAAW